MLPKTSFFVSAPSLFLGVVDAVIETFSEKQKLRFEACILFAASDIAAFFVSSRVADSRLLSDRTQNAKKILCLCRRRQKCIFVLLLERPQFLSLLFRLGKLSGSEIGKAHGDQTSITFGCTFFATTTGSSSKRATSTHIFRLEPQGKKEKTYSETRSEGTELGAKRRIAFFARNTGFCADCISNREGANGTGAYKQLIASHSIRRENTF